MRLFYQSLYFLMALGATLMTYQDAAAGLIVRFDSMNYFGNPGSTVNVTMRLEANDDSASGGADHTELLRNSGMNGLFSLGVMVMNDNLASATSNGADVVATSDIAVNATHFGASGVPGAPGLPLLSVGAGTAGIRAISSDAFEGVQAGTTGPFIVDVASLTYTLGADVGEVTTLTLADVDPDPMFADTLDTLGNVLDSLVDFTASATITAVPEPGTCGWLLIGSFVWIGRRRRVL